MAVLGREKKGQKTISWTWTIPGASSEKCFEEKESGVSSDGERMKVQSD